MTPAPEELMPKILWSDIAMGLRCVCEAEEFTLTDENAITCEHCGRTWELSWKLWCTLKPHISCGMLDIQRAQVGAHIRRLTLVPADRLGAPPQTDRVNPASG